MKIIEAMKTIKEFQMKADDLRKKIAAHCADLDFETPVYQDQAEQVRQWLQAHTDLNKEILKLRVAIQRTNISTEVDMELGGKVVRKTIAEWIHRRRDLAKLDIAAWSMLTDRGLKEGKLPSSTGGTETMVKIRRYYNPLQRDEMLMMYHSEPGVIDRTLEVVNATTDLI